MEFVYDSADAAGQNAVTVTTWHACQWAFDRITREFPDINIREFYIDTKLSGDKNAVAKNYIKGRGIEVQAEAYITESVLQNVLKVTNTCDVVSMKNYFNYGFCLLVPLPAETIIELENKFKEQFRLRPF